MKATCRGPAGQKKKGRGRERNAGLPRRPTAPPDLCAVAVGSNQVAGGDVEVLPDAGKHGESGVSRSPPDSGRWANLSGWPGAPSGSRLRPRIPAECSVPSLGARTWGPSTVLTLPKQRPPLGLTGPSADTAERPLGLESNVLHSHPNRHSRWGLGHPLPSPDLGL